MTATRVRSWANFERRFDPITHADGSLLWDWCDLPKPIDIHRTWTVVDCDGKLYVTTGLHYVNRIGYLRTGRPWSAEDELQDYRYD